MQGQYSAMKCAVLEKEDIIKELNSEVFTLNSELDTVRQTLLKLSEKNEMLEGNLQANQVIFRSRYCVVLWCMIKCHVTGTSNGSRFDVCVLMLKVTINFWFDLVTWTPYSSSGAAIGLRSHLLFYRPTGCSKVLQGCSFWITFNPFV